MLSHRCPCTGVVRFFLRGQHVPAYYAFAEWLLASFMRISPSKLCAVVVACSLHLESISKHALHFQWLLPFFMDISPRRLCAVVIVDSLLGQHLPICSAFFVVDIVFLHGHLSQEALRCGDCCLSSRIASPSMLCIRSGCWFY